MLVCCFLDSKYYCFPSESGGPGKKGALQPWIPAFAGKANRGYFIERKASSLNPEIRPPSKLLYGLRAGNGAVVLGDVVHAAAARQRPPRRIGRGVHMELRALRPILESGARSVQPAI